MSRKSHIRLEWDTLVENSPKNFVIEIRRFDHLGHDGPRHLASGRPPTAEAAALEEKQPVQAATEERLMAADGRLGKMESHSIPKEHFGNDIPPFAKYFHPKSL